MMLPRTLILIAALVAVTGPEAARATGSFALETVQATVCAPVDVDLTTSDPGPGLGFDFTIAYDRNRIDVTNVALTSYGDGCLVEFNDPSDPGDPDFGSVVIAIACEQARVGSGILATITASPVANGTSALTFSNCEVNETNCTAATAGSVQVSCFPTPTPTSTPVCSDSDSDGVCDEADNCPYASNPDQLDRGGIGTGSAPDGIGDACQCGDVNGDGRVLTGDSTIILRSLLNPPTATQAKPQLCDVGGSAGCFTADATIILRRLLSPPTATIQQNCAAALPPSP